MQLQFYAIYGIQRKMLLLSNSLNFLSLSPEEHVQTRDTYNKSILKFCRFPLHNQELYLLWASTNRLASNVPAFLAKCYDPLGFIAPVIFHIKRLVQVLWHNHSDLGWDKMLPEERNKRIKHRHNANFSKYSNS